MIHIPDNQAEVEQRRPRSAHLLQEATISLSSHDDQNGARSPEHRHLGAAVAELRKLHGLSQAEVADRAELRRSHLAAIERGEVDPTFVTLVRIVRAIPAPLAELFELFERRRDAAGDT
jgi:DNA-binding XRE family transcriptional regulator